MKKPKILVSAVGGDIGQSVIKCLRDSPHIPYIVGCDMNPFAAGRSAVDKFHQAPAVKEGQRYTDFLINTIELENIDYVFLLSDFEINFFNDNRKKFMSLPATFMISEKELIDVFMDKYKTIAFFNENNLPHPRTYLPEEFNHQLDFPLILKKRRGSGSQNLFKVEDDEELAFYLKRNQDMIIQEYLPGEDNEFTAGLFSDGTKIETIVFKRILAPGGFSQQVTLINRPEITEFLRRLNRRLTFTGSINVQFRQTSAGYVPFEINPRFSSTVYFRHMFGFQDVLWWLGLVMGEPVNYPRFYRKGIGVRNYNEVFFDFHD